MADGGEVDCIEEAAAWLRSDWSPVGSELTDEQAARRKQLRETIAAVRRAVTERLPG